MGRPVHVVDRIDRETFETHLTVLNQPVLMKGQVADWPAVAYARQSDDAVIGYLKSQDNGHPAGAMLGDPAINGEFFYDDTLMSYNFQRGLVPISLALDRLIEQRDATNPYAIYVQSAPVKDHLRHFAEENILPLVPSGTEPRIWIGNRLRVQTHHDLTHNIACVVAGQRRFTMFPPEQLVNLYIGPFENTLAGPPVSLVRLEDPDYERFPRFRAAEAEAQYADLEPGDALFIPYGWWHHVRSQGPLNILVNYWWKDTTADMGEPYDCLLHGLLALRDLPAAQRDMWRVMFEHYVFGRNGDPAAHLAIEQKGAQGPMTPEFAAAMKRQLLQSLNQSWPKTMPSV